MKGDREGYIDEEKIYADPEVDGCDSGVDGKASFMKADDRIASALSIFDRPMGRSGVKDPSSIATAGEAEDALEHEGETDPDSISTADEIIDVSKSAEDIGEISDRSGTTDPDSIASSGSAQEALAHEGETDPDSIAAPDPAVSMDGGNNSEGSKKALDISIEKSIGGAPRSFSEDEVRAMLMQALGNDPASVDRIMGGEAAQPVPDIDNVDVMKSEEEPVAVCKSGGKHMITLREAFAIAKSTGRPNLMSSAGAEMAPPDLDSITKSETPSVKMGRGVDPMKVIEKDLNEWNIYKARNKFSR